MQLELSLGRAKSDLYVVVSVQSYAFSYICTFLGSQPAPEIGLHTRIWPAQYGMTSEDLISLDPNFQRERSGVAHSLLLMYSWVQAIMLS